jgi:uncharacterized protein YjlB
MEQHVNAASEVSHHVFPGDKIWPNNNHLPVLIYRNVFNFADHEGADEIEKHFKENDWSNSWKEGVYQYHHYHSNTHEALGISSGNIMLNLGGDDGDIITLSKGDVIIIPAGVAHKNVGCSEDFQCVGAYPKGEEYDMNTGEAGERPKADENIANVELPETDPVFGDKGPILEHWKKDESKKVLETVRQF